MDCLCILVSAFAGCAIAFSCFSAAAIYAKRGGSFSYDAKAMFSCLYFRVIYKFVCRVNFNDTRKGITIMIKTLCQPWIYNCYLEIFCLFLLYDLTVTNDSTDEWLTLDQKVHTYPTVRGFTAIGTGGDDFVQSMIVAVEFVLQQPIPEDIFYSAQ